MIYDRKAPKIIAKTLYRELVRNNFSTADIINLTKELIEQVVGDKLATSSRQNATLATLATGNITTESPMFISKTS